MNGLGKVAVLAIVPSRRVPRWQANAIESLAAEPFCTLQVALAAGDSAIGTTARLLAHRWFAETSLDNVAEVGESAGEPADIVIDFRTQGNRSQQPIVGTQATWVPEFDTTTLELPFADRIGAGAITVEARLRVAGTSVLLRSGRFGVRHTYACTMNDVFRHLHTWPALCVRLHALGKLTPVSTIADFPIVQPLKGSGLLRFGVVQTYRLMRAILRYLWLDDSWDIGTISVPIERFTSGQILVTDVRWLHPHERRPFYADPFYLAGPKPQILCEVMSQRARQGSLVALEVDNEWKLLRQKSIASAGGHWSYPSILLHDGKVLCLPETTSRGRIDAYEISPETFTLSYRQTMLDGISGCDNTIVAHNGVWWMFCTHAGQDSNSALYAYHSAGPLGPWEPHVSNPVKVDLANARPAGPFFTHAGNLYRPSQDGSAGYGGAVVINRVLQLDKDAFVEEPVARVASGNTRMPHGIHTFALLPDGRALIDAKREFISMRKTWAVLQSAGRCVMKKSKNTLEGVNPPNRLRQLALAFPLQWNHRRRFALPGGTLGNYYIAWDPGRGVFGEDWNTMPRDENGVLLTGGEKHYHAITISQYALYRYERWQEGDGAALEDFLVQARWLRDNHRLHRAVSGCYVFEFPWPKYGVESGWISAMAQGEAISVLLRAHQVSPRAGFDVAAYQVAEPFRFTLAEGGVVYRRNTHAFLEEVAVDPAAHILNGCIFALWGIWELNRFVRAEWRTALISEVLQTIRDWLPLYDRSGWSTYSLLAGKSGRRHISTLKYHAFHIAQLRVLAVMTGDSIFEEYANRWESYVEDIPNRGRVLIRIASGIGSRLLRNDTIAGGARSVV